MTDNIHSTKGFGYLAMRLCDRCYRPNHIFVESDDKRELCLQCHDNYSDLEGVRIPNSETYPVLDEPLPKCQVCELPALADSNNWSLTKAYLSDSTTELKAHLACSSKLCSKCELRFAIIQNRNWRASYMLSHTLFSDITLIEGDEYCDTCSTQFWEENDKSDYYPCPCCEHYTHDDNTLWWDNEKYCRNCYENNVFSCNDCSEMRWGDDDHDCEQDSDDDSALIHSYSYRPSPFFFGEGKYHFGFELEVEARGNGRYDGAILVQNTLGGHAYLKEDGSLDDGFEIVTHPHTLEKYHTDFNWSVLDKLKRDGYRSWNTSTCGIHVHVSRTAFGNGDPWRGSISNSVRSQMILQRQSHELRFMKLIYDNQRQVERISGRSSDRYASFNDKGQLVRKIKNGYQTNGRFSAINTENDDTIEIRVFKGSLRKERVLSAIEFVHATVEYTRDIKVTTKNHALSWLKFTGYVAANAELYPNLVTIMGESFANDITSDDSDN